eukprot:14667367-Alexandrium_andersonii.AAC.1
MGGDVPRARRRSREDADRALHLEGHRAVEGNSEAMKQCNECVEANKAIEAEAKGNNSELC